MTPAEALAFLDSVLARMSGSRADHAQIVQAVQTLQQALPPGDDNGD